MTTIELDHITKTYPRQPRPAIDQISLTVETGELLALLGPSGSGKSTILKMIAGIEHADHGDIRLDNRSVRYVPANRRGTVLMFQKAYLFPFLNVAENIGFGLKVAGADRRTIAAEVGQMLELVELPGIERRMPAQLSGGEQQRVALARALVTRPRVLMLDEPLSSLDTNVRLALQAAIRRIQRELQTTTLLVTHDLSEAIAMSDRTAVLLDGRLAAIAAPAKLFQRPPNQAAARFVGVDAIFHGILDQTLFVASFGTLAVNISTPSARPAIIAIRPEQIVLQNAPGPNAFGAIIAEVEYRGDYTDYQVTLLSTTVRVRSFQDSGRFRIGDAVFVMFPAEHLFELAEGAVWS